MQDGFRKVLGFSGSGGRIVLPTELVPSSLVASFPVRALRTADGGALVSYATRTAFAAEVKGGSARPTPTSRPWPVHR
jgi:hypothetical protein